MSDARTAVVIGGGLGGLLSACRLRERGHAVVLLERASALGGRAITTEHDGFRFNLGPRAFYPNGPAKAALDELGIRVSGDKTFGHHGFFIDHEGAWPIPLGLWQLIRAQHWTPSERFELFKRTLAVELTDRKRLEAQTAEEWFASASPKVRSALHVMARLSTYVHAPQLLSAAQAQRQMQAAARGVRYLDGGWQSLVDALAERALRAGVELRTGSAAQGVEAVDGRLRVAIEGQAALDADSVIFAGAPGSLRALLPDDPHAQRYVQTAVPVKAACLDVALSKLPRPDCLVALGVDQPLYFAVHSAYAKLTPGQGSGALLHVMRNLAPDEHPSAQDAKAHEAQLHAFLERLQPGWQSHVVFQRFLPQIVVAHDVLPPQHIRRRPPVAHPALPGLFLVGDWIGDDGILLDCVASTSREAVRLASLHTQRKARPFSTSRQHAAGRDDGDDRTTMPRAEAEPVNQASAVERTIDSALTRLTRWALDHRRSVMFLLAGIVCLACLSLLRLRFDYSPDSFFMKDDPALLEYQRFQQVYGSDSFVYVRLDAPQRWTPENVQTLRDVEDSFKAIEGVTEVASLASAPHLSTQDDTILSQPYMPKGLSGEAIAQRVEQAKSHPFYGGLYVSTDGKYVGVLAVTRESPGLTEKQNITRNVRELLASPKLAALHPQVVGKAMLDVDMNVIATQESMIFGTAVFLLIAAGLWWMFRSFLGVALPLGAAMLGMLATFSIMTLLDAPFGLLSPIIPAFMLSVGTAGTVYLLGEIYEELRQGGSVREAVLAAVRGSGTSGTMSVLTTAGGILAFSSSRVRPLQELGLSMGLGLLCCLVLTMLMIPVGLTLFGEVRPSASRDRILSGRVQIMVRLAEVVMRHYRVILVGIALLLVAAVAGALRLKSDYYYLGMFKEHAPVRLSYNAVESTLSGGSSIELTLRPKSGDVRTPELLNEMLALQSYVKREVPELAIRTYSIADVLCELNKVLHDGDPKYYAIPDSQPAVAQLLLLLQMSGSGEYSKLLREDFSETRIRMQLRTYPDSVTHRLFDAIDHFADQHWKSGASASEVGKTGLIKLWVVINDYVYDSQLRTVQLTVPIVILVMMIVLRSIRLALMMCFANAAVIVVALGAMGWFGINLDPYTVLIASLALGILDDDSIHLVRKVQRGLAENLSLEDSIRAAYATTGQAMFGSALILAASFSVYKFSIVQSLGTFGMVVALTILIGAVMEMLLTPSLLLAGGRFLFPNALTRSNQAAADGVDAGYTAPTLPTD
ncbi:MAG TPA: FAD-dependent oxidoreductase [Polyangiales bacterium]|nr:FAD-dependent oxidoreductase [Polyangiales bacterium]